MPRKPTDNVVEHRITLGVWERKLIEEKIIPTYQAKEVGETTASILQAIGSVSAGTIAAYLSLWTAWKTFPTLKDEMKEQIGKVAEVVTGTSDYFTEGEFIPEDDDGQGGKWNPITWLSKIFIPFAEPIEKPSE